MNFTQRKLTVLLAILLLSAFGGALEANAQIGRSESELPLPTQRVIRSMATGSEGYLWLGTQHGLFRFDGHRYVAYTNSPNNPNRISQNNVLEVVPTTDGRLVLFNNIYTADILNPESNQLTVVDLGAETTPRGKIRTVSKQSDGQIFFLTEHNEGYAIFKYSEGNFVKLFERRESRLTNPELTISTSRRFFLSVQQDSTLMLYDQENGLLHYNTEGQLIRRFTSKSDIGEGKALNFFQQINEREILLSYSEEKGIYRIDLSSGSIESDQRFTTKYSYVLCHEDLQGNLLIGAKEVERQIKSFFILDSEDRLTEINDFGNTPPIEHFVYGQDFLDYFYTISVNGLFQIKTGLRHIKSYHKEQDFSIRGMIEDDYGNLIVATEWHGWYKLNPSSDHLEPIDMSSLKINDLAPSQYARNLVKDANGEIWGSAYGNPPVTSTPDGYLLRYRPSDGRTFVYKNKYRIEALLLSQNGPIYLASNSTFQVFNPTTGQFQDIPGNYGSLSDEEVIPNCILESKSGLIWIGTDNGLARFDAIDQSFLFYGDGIEDELPLSNRNIMAIHEDANGRLWLGTQGGLYCFDPSTRFFEAFNKRNGLPDNNVCGILQDKKGNLWITTFKGISYFDREVGQFRNFYTSDGFNHNEFNRHALYRSKDGTYFAGGMNGFNSFKAEDLLKIRSSYKILFSEIAYFESKVDSLITQTHGLSQLKSVTLPAANRFLQVRFGLNNFSHPEQNNYSVFLEGYDSDWISQGNLAEVRYNNLPPGDYRLHIRGTGPSGTLSENMLVLDIQVKQFFFKSLWFNMLLFLLSFGLISLWIVRLRTEKNRLALEVAKRTEQILSDKEIIEKQTHELQTLDRMKSRFFANISHELRTPLTLILSPLKRMLANKNLEVPTIHQHLELMEKNGQLLHYRIEELLELSRLDAGKAVLINNPVNLEQYLRQIIERFSPIAIQKNIELTYNYQADSQTPVLIDATKFEKIVSNLLSNALKFTTNGKVEMRAEQFTKPPFAKDQRLLILTVRDTGIGIASEEVPFIFDRYFQAQNGNSIAEGTGIGLSMAKEFAMLMGGDISVQSELKKGSTFTLTLPVSLAEHQSEGYDTDENIAKLPKETNNDDDRIVAISPSLSKNEFTILHVEDNSDLRNFLQDILRIHFKVIPVEHGKQAYEYLTQQPTPIHDLLVLSDVMMPEMDGFTLLDLVRSKESLRRIPFIMLTAKAGGEHRIRALRMGVDDYILKPFDEEELLVRIKNLLLNLQMRQELAEESEEIGHVEEEIGPEWLEILENTVLNSLSDAQMGMDFLAEKMGLSRSSLHRRIKVETGLTPNMYLREIRLQEARRLIEHRLVATVAEAGQKVGLQKRAYFSNLFQERFGRLPSTYFEESSQSR